jgi:Mrp family chromosome partitioning ATPase
MSRNYELLQKAAMAERVLPTRLRADPDGSNGHQHWFDGGEPGNEEVNKLVRRIFPLADTPGLRSVVFAGVGGDRGCARVCAMAAQALSARAGGTVCVVDANFYSPSLHEYFNMGNGEGLSEGILASGPIHGLARRIAASNLWLLPCGSHAASPATLATADRLTIRIKELSEEFNQVLINAPAADKYSDAMQLGRLSDGVILVIEANSTSRGAAQKTKQSLQASDVHVLGAVLNNRTFPIPESIYKRLR